jgi:hypothetical protein
MYIESSGQIFMLDRDNSVFRVRYLNFPQRKALDKHISNTLVDGVEYSFIHSFIHSSSLFESLPLI